MATLVRQLQAAVVIAELSSGVRAGSEAHSFQAHEEAAADAFQSQEEANTQYMR